MYMYILTMFFFWTETYVSCVIYIYFLQTLSQQAQKNFQFVINVKDKRDNLYSIGSSLYINACSL